jgi:hypothetical protein
MQLILYEKYYTFLPVTIVKFIMRQKRAEKEKKIEMLKRKKLLKIEIENLM